MNYEFLAKLGYLGKKIVGFQFHPQSKFDFRISFAASIKEVTLH